MSILKVSRLGHPILRSVAEPISLSHLKSPNLQKLIDDMIQTMREYEGVGLAAVQVHEPKQIAVLEVADNPRYPQKPKIPLAVFLNPEITPLADDKEKDWEGCLSIPELRGRVSRYKNIQVHAWDRHGKELEFTASGFHARVIQHEWDHLHGKVFLDRMEDLSTLTYLQELQRYWAEKQQF